MFKIAKKQEADPFAALQDKSIEELEAILDNYRKENPTAESKPVAMEKVAKKVEPIQEKRQSKYGPLRRTQSN